MRRPESRIAGERGQARLEIRVGGVPIHRGKAGPDRMNAANASGGVALRHPLAMSRLAATAVWVALLFAWQTGPAPAGGPLRFRVQLDADMADGPIDGRLFVFLSQGERRPRPSPFNWARTDPFFGLDVRGFQPGTSRQIDDRADGYPDRLSRLPPGEYWVKALLDHDFYCPHPDLGVGNLYSGTQRLKLDPASSGTVELFLEHVVEPEPFPETKWFKEVAIRSTRLSEFHGREVIERAAVALPPSYYAVPDRRYPVVYSIPGFGASHNISVPSPGFGVTTELGTIHYDLARVYSRGPLRPEAGEVEFIWVLLSGQCKWGHHCYANSATNGPRGDALVYELIPHIDRKFRTVSAPTARFLTGHSSGGWSSLWLQVSYPQLFGGVWSSAPDAVDFRSFPQVNLYADPPMNFYRDQKGRRRPIARRGTRPWLWAESFCRRDDCLGRGGLLRSFEAVFSPRGPDRLPRRLWDRETGCIDSDVARAWQKYDIRLLFEQNWGSLGPKLRGKLHIVVGELDTFYLEGAVRRLAETLRRLGSDAQIEIIPGADHFSLATRDLRQKFRRQMSEVYLKNHSENRAKPDGRSPFGQMPAADHR